MIPIAAIPSLVACLSYAYLAAFALSLDKKSTTVRLFVLVQLLFFLWSGGAAGLILSAADPTARAFWERITYFGAGTYAVAGFFLFKSISGYDFGPLRVRISALAMLPVLVIQVASLGWNAVARQFPAGPFFIAHHAATNAYSICGLMLVGRWSAKSRLCRERRQGRMILVATLIGIPLGLLLDFLLGFRGIPSQANLVPVAWSAALFIAIARYDLFRDSVSSSDLGALASCEEAVLVFDSGLQYAAGNEAAGRLIGSTGSYQRSLDSLFAQSAEIRRTLFRLSLSGGTSLDITGLLRQGKGIGRMVGLHFILLRDRWSDPLRFICFVRPALRVRQMADEFLLSRREREVMEYILTGASQQATAEALCISLPTVKTHTANLYNKLGIDSRNELFALLGGEGFFGDTSFRRARKPALDAS